ncbi:hypothetical protein [Clostridium thermobutyricum]|uniref:hypothetical protein n=1 Tax=Clostridium thermobutyricum TaxID=29372 RepID=UPI002941D3E0|nr:hypothetical protein [Clostridium thermobutyricum]
MKKRLRKLFSLIILIIVVISLVISYLPITTGDYSVKKLIYSLIGLIVIIIMGVYEKRIKLRKKF